ncbi:DUF89 domain-containing protein [Verrucomicrobiota bacterium]
MKTYDMCLSCLEGLTKSACKIANLTEEQTQKILRAADDIINNSDRKYPPIAPAREIFKHIISISGNPDPYAKIKKESNSICAEIYPMLKERLARSEKPMEAAVKMAIAGNVIDFGIFHDHDFSREDIWKKIEETLAGELSGDSIDDFASIVKDSKKILYVADNAGECFFDSLLLDLMPKEKITYAVRGGPILNDAIREDASAAGIVERCSVIDTGDNSPGVFLDRCSEEFLEAFKKSDLVIAKGHGNYESLDDVKDRTCVFITKIKCEVVAKHTGFPLGSNVLMIQSKYDRS